jgi:hypothetical protein
MGRKVIQEFVNSFCQHMVDLPSGFDLASFVHYGSGKYQANILSGDCTYNDTPIPSLKHCDVYRDWTLQQLEKHGIQLQGIGEAGLQVTVEIRDISLRHSFGHRFASAHFFSYAEAKSEPTRNPTLARCAETKSGDSTGITKKCTERCQTVGRRPNRMMKTAY